MQEEATDLSYSAVIEILARAGALSMAREGLVDRAGKEHGELDRGDELILQKSAEEPYKESKPAAPGEGDIPFPGGEFAREMLPHLVKGARARWGTIKLVGREEKKSK